MELDSSWSLWQRLFKNNNVRIRNIINVKPVSGTMIVNISLLHEFVRSDIRSTLLLCVMLINQTLRLACAWISASVQLVKVWLLFFIGRWNFLSQLGITNDVRMVFLLSDINYGKAQLLFYSHHIFKCITALYGILKSVWLLYVNERILRVQLFIGHVVQRRGWKIIASSIHEVLHRKWLLFIP